MKWDLVIENGKLFKSVFLLVCFKQAFLVCIRILWWMKGYCSSALYPFKVQCCTTSLKRLSLWSSILNLTSVRPLFLYTLPWSPPFWTLNATMTPHYFKSKKFNSLLTKSPVILWSHNNSSHFSCLNCLVWLKHNLQLSTDFERNLFHRSQNW